MWANDDSGCPTLADSLLLVTVPALYGIAFGSLVHASLEEAVGREVPLPVPAMYIGLLVLALAVVAFGIFVVDRRKSFDQKYRVPRVNLFIIWIVAFMVLGFPLGESRLPWAIGLAVASPLHHCTVRLASRYPKAVSRMTWVGLFASLLGIPVVSSLLA